jgi:hypothetical protein
MLVVARHMEQTRNSVNTQKEDKSKAAVCPRNLTTP